MSKWAEAKTFCEIYRMYRSDEWPYGRLRSAKLAWWWILYGRELDASR